MVLTLFLTGFVFGYSGSSTTGATAAAPLPMLAGDSGSFTLFQGRLETEWAYNDVTQTVTIVQRLDGALIGGVALTPSNTADTISATVGNTSTTSDFEVNFGAKKYSFDIDFTVSSATQNRHNFVQIAD